MSPPARAEFIRGPYDGLIIDVEQVDRFVRDDAVQESYDNRLFLLMPPPFDWDRVVGGEANRDGPFDRSYPYEVSVGPRGVRFVYCAVSQYLAAFKDEASP
jgi:hypothetical protein